MDGRHRCGLMVTLLLAAGCFGGRDEVVVIDDFEGAPAWTAHPADGVALDLSVEAGPEGGALRLDFGFAGGGYAIARREVDLALPENYAFRFRLRGRAPANHLEFKLVDAGGENVWWHVQRDVVWPDRWQTVSIRRRQISYAWGPQGGGEPRRIAAIEFAVTAGSGGSGTVWIDDLELVPLPVPTGPPPAPLARASSASAGHEAALAVDGQGATAWEPAADDPAPALELDLGPGREFGGLILTWAPGRRAADHTLEASADGKRWSLLQTTVGAGGDRDYLYLPESEARYLRLRLRRDVATAPPLLRELTIEPLAFAASREAFFAAVAADARRGVFPRGLRDEQVYWTVVGADRDPQEGLLSADGALEAGAGQFSVEPFLQVDGRLLTWADVTTEQTLADGCLPVPTVTWRHDDWELRITAFAVGEPGSSGLVARYRLANLAPRARSATLALAVRPFQVNPPSQFLNLRGGTAPIRSLARSGDTITVDGRPRIRLLGPPPDQGMVAAFAAGDPVRDVLDRGLPPTVGAGAVDDPLAAASAVVTYELALPAGGTAERGIAVAWPGGDLPADPGPDAAAWSARHQAEAEAGWRAALGGVRLSGPPAAADLLLTLRAQLGYILVNRAGVAIQPGTRAYARSWIRDGALTSGALLRLGQPAAARDFLEWYAGHQYPSGKIPCVVDARGADPVPEHDSTGEYIFLVAEIYRYTRDLDLLRRHWPRVTAGIGYLESLLAERRSEEYLAPDRREFYGILPPSISHEGYSAKPMHSYWDDFFAARGYKDAAWLAGELVRAGADSLGAQAAQLAADRDRFLGDLGRSVAAAMARHGIDYVPGCADLGDFDPTSTTIALAPAEVADLLPPGALERTFDRYWEFFTARREGAPWDAYTPYELRNVGASVRLGHRERALAMLDFFLGDRRPAGWRHWAEVVRHDAGAARFLGDMPHTWVGSDFIRSLLDMFAYAEGTDSAAAARLVLAAGLPAAWLEDGGIAVANLPTPFGPLTYSLRRAGRTIVLELGATCAVPPGGIVLRPPAGGMGATVDGRGVPAGPDGEVRLEAVPAVVVWSAGG